MTEIVILDYNEEESFKLKNELEKSYSKVSVYNPEREDNDYSQSTENSIIFFCKLDSPSSSILDDAIKIASSESDQIVFIVPEADDVFLDRISRSDTIHYLKEPYTRNELSYMIKKASNNQHTSMEDLHLLSESVYDIAFTMTATGDIIYVSPSVKRITGFSQKEVLNKGLKELVPEDSFNFIGGMIGTFFAKLEKGEKVRSPVFELEILCKDESTLWMELTINCIFDSERNFRYFAGVMHNINNRKEAEERFKAAVECSGDLIYEWDMKTDNLEWFGNIEQMLGYEYDELPGTINEWSKIIHPDDLPIVKELIDNYRRTGDIFELEYRVFSKDGELYHLKEHGTPIFDKITKQFIKTIGVCTNITDKVEAEKALEEKEELFRLIAENANDVIWVLDAKGDFLYVSPSVEKLRGYTPEELMALPIEERLTPESSKVVMDTWTQFFQRFKKGIIPDTPRIIEVEQPCKDGSTVWTELHINPVLDDDGNFKFFLGISRDISTHRKQARMLDSIFNLTPIPMILLDGNGIVEKINKECTVIPGVNKKTAIGKKAGEIFSCAYSFKEEGCGTNEECNSCTFSNLEQETFRTHRNFNKVEGISTTRMPDGSDANLNLEVSTAYIDLYDDAKVIMCFEDVTERKKTEEEIIESKLEAEEANRTKSEFLATISHELRTPLNAIIGYSQMLQDDNFGDLNPKQEKFANHIHTSGKHLLELINDILDLSKIEAGKMDLHLETFEVNKVLKNVYNIISPLAEKKNIELDFAINQDISIYADKVRYKQILYNLLSNAVKFTPDGGNVTVKISVNDDILTTSIIDDGIGIAPEEQKKLFTPFYQADSSNARKYQGTGLGLSIVKKMVELHGGTIKVESEPVKGSTFTFTSPVKTERSD
ncbi:PAS domain-containing sensor histidine kinase [Methanolobus bombayensis]|uniref:PAS domain-containing sensor histidine kinase n=1 Tax=Methanolobus bombayensis TaxID=38023 RepID=UPI001AE9F4D3|nr:PAS domain-containing sensor histidine kinase [Methanolobus bombayensis]MBP1908725.1 PAS domain S-box-containing protein [Methanolobus bombayensis]